MTNEIDFNTLTLEQQEMLNVWYIFKLDDSWNLQTLEPKKKTKEFIEYKKQLIQKEFDYQYSQLISWYWEWEVYSWNQKVLEAEKVKNWEKSDYLEKLCIEWESVKNLAEIILLKHKEFVLTYSKIEKNKRIELQKLFDNQ